MRIGLESNAGRRTPAEEADYRCGTVPESHRTFPDRGAETLLRVVTHLFLREQRFRVNASTHRDRVLHGGGFSK